MSCCLFSQLESLLLVYVILPGREDRCDSSHLVAMKPQPSSLSWHSKLSWCCRHRHSTFQHVSSLKLLILRCVGYPARIFFWIKWVAKQARSSGNTSNHFCDQHMNFKNHQYKLQWIIWHSGTSRWTVTTRLEQDMTACGLLALRKMHQCHMTLQLYRIRNVIMLASYFLCWSSLIVYSNCFCSLRYSFLCFCFSYALHLRCIYIYISFSCQKV